LHSREVNELVGRYEFKRVIVEEMDVQVEDRSQW
jgi:hypothetical protein